MTDLLLPSSFSRREFLHNTAVAGAGILSGIGRAEALVPTAGPSELYALCQTLSAEWLAALLALQITDKARGADYGGIRGPGDAAVPGRIAETIYPLLHQAHRTGQARYIDAARLLYQWAETQVSQADGSWLNEPQPGSWKGTTVFMATALAEAVHRHGAVLDEAFRSTILARLRKAGEFISRTFNMDYGNINYPINAAYALALLGEVLDVPQFREQGRAFAHQALRFFSPTNTLIFGEGTPYYETSPKGCYPVDLGYNVEESLPALVQYGLLTRDEEVLGTVIRSLQTHLEFMLPDGGWDNSWGTRNYKWTYWGSRTADGCQPAYALLAARDPRFYKAALRNTQLMQRCTANGLLQGGPHVAARGLPPSVHHTFCHLKALTTVLDSSPAPAPNLRQTLLPREQAYGSRFFADIQTWLIAQGDFRATVTASDREYKAYHNGHATGGALTLLWHPQTGPLLAASMTEYQRFEAGNMPPETTPPTVALTPRIELRLGETLYTNISDLTAQVAVTSQAGTLTLTTHARLVDKTQQNPPTGPINCTVTYTFAKQGVTLHFSVDAKSNTEVPTVILPLISPATEAVKRVSDRSIHVAKVGATVTVTASQPLIIPAAGSPRVFNFVPGFEALLLSAAHREVSFTIAVA